MTTLDQLRHVLGARLAGSGGARPGEVTIRRAVIDSRLVEPGDVFWALPGATRHGVEFVADAMRRGATAAVVDRPCEAAEDHWILRVDDGQVALRRFAEWKRGRMGGTVVAVVGSVGKTTTRQMIHTVLRSRLRGVVSPANYNNHLGVPLSMTAIEPEHDYAVLELGASRPGEIAALAALCRPKVGVITRVGDAHLGSFGDRRTIARAKAELLGALPPDGLAVIGDDAQLRHLAAGCPAPVAWVGTDENCDIRASEVRAEAGQLRFRIEGVGFRVPVWGRHHLTAALAAVAVGRLLGFDLAAMADALEEYHGVPMRCEVIESRGATIINDTYNSSPTAMRAALELLGEFDPTGRRIVICGDMAELGEESGRLHWQLGRQIVEIGAASLVIACGQYARFVVGGARAAGMPEAHAIACASRDEVLPLVGQAIQPGDVVLVKGSRMMGMERLVEAMYRYPLRRSA